MSVPIFSEKAEQRFIYLSIYLSIPLSLDSHEYVTICLFMYFRCYARAANVGRAQRASNTHKRAHREKPIATGKIKLKNITCKLQERREVANAIKAWGESKNMAAQS
jgi:hypothetical protein